MSSRNVFRLLALAVAIWMAVVAQSHENAHRAAQQQHMVQRQ